MPFINKSEVKKGWETRKKTAKNKFVCVRTGVQMLFGENIIYLHNLHKLLCRHLTRFMSAFRRRSLPPVFPRGEGTTTRRLQKAIHHWQFISFIIKAKVYKFLISASRDLSAIWHFHLIKLSAFEIDLLLLCLLSKPFKSCFKQT